MSSLFRRLSSWWKKEPTPVSLPAIDAPAPASVLSHSPTLAVQSQVVSQLIDSSQPLSEDLIFQALRKCRDPEIPVNIVDLGLIYDVRIADDLVNVKMTLTTQGCGMGGYISQE